MGGQNPDKIDAARGGKVTLDQTAKLAEAMGMTPQDLLARKVGELYDGPKQVAAAQLFIQSAKRMKDAPMQRARPAIREGRRFLRRSGRP